MATDYKKASDITQKTSIDLANDNIMAVNGTSNYNIPMQKIAEAISKFAIGANADGVMIYTIDSNGVLRLIRPAKWPSYKTSGYTPIGIAVTNGEKRLVVSLDECTSEGLNWSTAHVSGGGVTDSNRQIVMADWNGASNTAAQAAKAECSGVNTAPGFCHAYSKLSADNKGLAAGKWHLPSLGELIMIYANKEKINYALSLIDGAAQLAETGYWSSTEYSDTYAWRVYFDTGVVNGGPKATGNNRVRPVAAFQ